MQYPSDHPPGGFRRHPFFVSSVAFLVVFASCLLSGALLYQRAASAQKEELRHGVLHLARAGALLVDGDLHRSFVSRDQEGTEAYRRALAPLDRLLRGNAGLGFVYTCILRHDSVFFVLDPTPPGDADGDGLDEHSHIGQPYADAGEACRKALETGTAQVDEEPYTDAWGTFLSAYAPILDSAGRKAGVFGVDLKLEAYLEQIRSFRRAGLWGGALALLLSLGVFFLVYRAVLSSNRLILDLRKARREAEDASRAKGRFLATMSHEIRTPLNGVLGMASLLEQSPLDPDQHDLAKSLQQSGEILLSLVNDILDISKIEAGKMDLEARPFDLAALVEEAVRHFSFRAAEKGLSLEARHDPEPGAGAPSRWRLGDAMRLRQILFNLVGNAIKFTDKGFVRIECHRGSTGITLKVVDTGIGLSPETRKKLFSAFYQGDNSTSRTYGGTGLGLTICQNLTGLMRGSLSVESEEGRGSTFSVRLPLKEAEAPASKDQAPVGPGAAGATGAPDGAGVPGATGISGSAASAPAPLGLHILQADDNAVNRKILGRMLQKLGCTFEAAADGHEAVELFEKGAYDLVLMDCHMPRMDGFEATAEIRRRGGTGIPILALTADVFAEEGEKARKSGMDAFLTKPLTLTQLQEALEKWGLSAQPKKS